MAHLEGKSPLANPRDWPFRGRGQVRKRSRAAILGDAAVDVRYFKSTAQLDPWRMCSHADYETSPATSILSLAATCSFIKNYPLMPSDKTLPGASRDACSDKHFVNDRRSHRLPLGGSLAQFGMAVLGRRGPVLQVPGVWTTPGLCRRRAHPTYGKSGSVLPITPVRAAGVRSEGGDYENSSGLLGEPRPPRHASATTPSRVRRRYTSAKRNECCRARAMRSSGASAKRYGGSHRDPRGPGFYDAETTTSIPGKNPGALQPRRTGVSFPACVLAEWTACAVASGGGGALFRRAARAPPSRRQGQIDGDRVKPAKDRARGGVEVRQWRSS